MGICLILIFALLAVLLFLLVLFERQESASGSLFTKLPFGVYAAWVTAVAIVNFAIFLKFEDVELSTSAWNMLGAVLIVFASVLAVIVRWRLKNYLYPFTIGWALTAIAIKQGSNTAIVITCAVGVVICLVTAGSFVVDLKDSTSE